MRNSTRQLYEIYKTKDTDYYVIKAVMHGISIVSILSSVLIPVKVIKGLLAGISAMLTLMLGLMNHVEIDGIKGAFDDCERLTREVKILKNQIEKED